MLIVVMRAKGFGRLTVQVLPARIRTRMAASAGWLLVTVGRPGPAAPVGDYLVVVRAALIVGSAAVGVFGTVGMAVVDVLGAGLVPRPLTGLVPSGWVHGFGTVVQQSWPRAVGTLTPAHPHERIVTPAAVRPAAGRRSR